jgi:hypothetical protein
MNKEEYLFACLNIFVVFKNWGVGDIILTLIDYDSDYQCFIETALKPKIRNLISRHNLNIDHNAVNFPNMENLEPVFSLINRELPLPMSEDDYWFITYLHARFYQYVVDYYSFKYPNFDFSDVNKHPDLYQEIIDKEQLNSRENSRRGDYFVELQVDYKDLMRRIAIAKTYEGEMYAEFLETSPHFPRFTQRKFLNVSLSDLFSSHTSFVDVVQNFVTGLYNFFKGYMSSETVEILQEVNTDEMDDQDDQDDQDDIDEIFPVLHDLYDINDILPPLNQIF